MHNFKAGVDLAVWSRGYGDIIHHENGVAAHGLTSAWQGVKFEYFICFDFLSNSRT